jgi:parvulin-like peptidyl-prolyl isomerase
VSRNRQRESRSRARGGASAQQQIIYIGSAVTLVAAALIIVAGVYITRIRPPRERVLTVQGEHFTAQQVVDRGAVLAAIEGRATNTDTLAADTIDAMIEESSLRQAGPALVGQVTQNDVDQEIASELGLAPLADAPTSTPIAATPGATGTATATPTPTPTPEPTGTAAASATATATTTPTARADYAKQYATFLQRLGLGRTAFEQIIRANIIRLRLEQQFQDSVGSSGPQVQLSRIRVNDSALAKVIADQLKNGGDFAKLHDQYSTGKESGAGGDIGWTAVGAQPTAVQDAIRSLKVGDVSDVVTQGTNFDLYKVTDSSPDRPYDDATKQGIVAQQVQNWLDVEKARLTVVRSMSASEETWINDHILTKAQALAQASGAQPPATGG